MGPKNIWFPQKNSAPKNLSLQKLFQMQKSLLVLKTFFESEVFGSEKKIVLEKIFSPKNFGFKKFLGKKSFGPNFLVFINFWLKKSSIENFLVKKMYGQKNFLVEGNFWWKKIFS